MIPAEHVERARSVPIERIIEERGIKLRGRIERIGPCPICGGTDRFSINVKKQVFNCRGCDIGGDVIKLIEHIDGVDFVTACKTLAGPEPKINGKDRETSKKVVVAEYPYHDQIGAIAFVVERIEYQNPDGSFVVKDGKRKKTFSQKRPDPDHPGEWLWNVDGVAVLPYRLPQLIIAIASGLPVLIVEGERKVDLLSSWDVAATCNACGAKTWKPEHSECLRGADVVLCPDNDDPGWEHINEVGASLVGIAKRIRVVRLPHAKAKDKADIVDWANAGGTREQLDALLDQAQDWKPPSADKTSEPNGDEKTAAKAREDELLDALAKAKGLDYVRQRKTVADELDVPPKAIDDEVKARREDAQIAPLYGHWIVEPWPDPVDGDCLLRDINRRIRRQVVCSSDVSLASALWAMFSWVHDEVAIYSPILLVTSPQPECGKGQLLGLIKYLTPRAIKSVNISKAALFRSIKRWQPSFIIDEFDTVLAARDGDQTELRAVINSGHNRGDGVIRCITDEHTPELFSTFAPKALGMIGRKMPTSTLSRCIIVELLRRIDDEKIDPFAHEDDAELAELRRRLRRWSMDNQDVLRDAKPPMPAGFSNRRADNWRFLLAIADLCSGVEDWGDKARQAAANLEGESDTASIGVQLLIDIKRIRDENKTLAAAGCILSAKLVQMLNADEEGPWIGWGHGKGLTQNSLATLLGGGGGRGRAKRGGFGIHSQTVHPPSSADGKGYKWSQFEDAWARYLPADVFPSEGGE